MAQDEWMVEKFLLGIICMKDYKNRIIDFLDNNPSQIYKSRRLARYLGVKNKDYQDFKALLRKMAEEGSILRHKGNKYGKYQKQNEVSGIIHIKAQGYGFLRRDDGEEDVFIGQKNMGNVSHNDRVRVVLFKKGSGRLQEGRVVEILERGNRRIVGTFHESRSSFYVVPDQVKTFRRIYVHKDKRCDASNGQKVVIEIENWGDSRIEPRGRIVRVLGYPEERGVDVLSIIHNFDLPDRFSDSVLNEAESFVDPVPESALKNRIDLRSTLTFTIDPPDAKDFDDAVSLERLKNGNFLLGVHIADVSYFVEPGSAIDREALRRGTSIYLVDRVIPMLPERLSNTICSLRPDEDRLTVSVLIEISPDGSLKDYSIRESVIRSRRRFEYGEVQELINSSRDGNERGSVKESHSSGRDREEKFCDVLIMMAHLSRKLKEKWNSAGSIDFYLPEPYVELDRNGVAVRLGIREHFESHEIIENFMLLANKIVAEHIGRLREERGRKYPFIYRVHERPSEEKLNSFVRFVRAMGYSFEPGRRVTPKRFQAFLDRVKGTKHEIVIEDVALRTMMKAVYSTKNSGHFGLAFKSYTHFTSPIRRYPDLVVHRLLKNYLQEQPERFHLPCKLSSICEISTSMEIRAQEAERESIRIKQVEFMERHIGDIFEGIISGVTGFGIFVEIPEYLVEGLVHIDTINDDRYIFNQETYTLTGHRSGRVFKLGDPVRVRVVRVVKEIRKIDFLLI